MREAHNSKFTTQNSKIGAAYFSAKVTKISYIIS